MAAKLSKAGQKYKDLAQQQAEEIADLKAAIESRQLSDTRLEDANAQQADRLADAHAQIAEFERRSSGLAYRHVEIALYNELGKQIRTVEYDLTETDKFVFFVQGNIDGANINLPEPR